MKTAIEIPQLPEDSARAKISHINVNEGQQVEAGQALFEVETDKVILEVEAPHSGVVEGLNISQGCHAEPEQITMYLRSPVPGETLTERKEANYREAMIEQVVKGDSDRVLLEQVIGERLFDKRGLMCGAIGCVVGVLVGVIGTYVLMGT
ncbi:lipoyl domain-containing protein [Pseudoalteromonas sp. McH1-42]|uniref:biotin/lipoyl-containing protein n=1 Tax=Pseudoalteromonas sp. McH1-42 TaxID=2917752 RepID=UPI001EF67F1E|nr:lipoyl domain-containing protein [Pseudoalteromonas sp. McH1-42]MCG7563287.1 lipoyl domain-containing protein [Pseudoalteromonas sp. McH1-42]